MRCPELGLADVPDAVVAPGLSPKLSSLFARWYRFEISPSVRAYVLSVTPQQYRFGMAPALNTDGAYSNSPM